MAADLAREPLTKESITAAAAALIVPGLIAWGAPLTDAQSDWLRALVPVLVAAWIAWRVRPKVTPVADPRDGQGRALVPADKEENEQ